MFEFAKTSTVRSLVLVALLLVAALLSAAFASRAGSQSLTEFATPEAGRMTAGQAATVIAAAQVPSQNVVRFVLLSFGAQGAQATGGSRIGQYLAP